MRKKEPPSPAMAAQHAGPPPSSLSLSPASLAEALHQKRDALEREVAAFRARKEEEFQAYQRRLSASALDFESLKLTGSLATTEKSGENAGGNGDCDGEEHQRRGLRLSAGDAGDLEGGTQQHQQQPSPLTPQHDKERELQGLFLPHFIPLLDDPPTKKRSASDMSRPHSAAAEIPARRPGVNSSDPSAFSPRTSPSPTLIALPFSSPSTTPAVPINPSTPKTQINPSFTFERPTPGATPSSVPLSPSAIPAHLRPSSRSASENNVASNDSSPLLAPTPDRPAMGTRTSSSQSDGSSIISLRSSMRKSSSLTRAGDPKSYKKKSVRISIGDSIMAPSESPVQTRSAFKPPATPGPMSSNSSSFSGPELASVGDGLGSFDDDRGRLDARNERAGKARIDDEGGARRRRKKRLGTPTALTTDSSSKSKSKSKADGPLDYFPPQPLRSPRLPVSNANGRYIGTDLIEPTTPTTPPAYQEDILDNFEDDDPLFGGGGVSPGRARREKKSRTQHDDDLFLEDEDGRDNEDMEVMNGHDLVETEEEDDAAALPSPSPHASSMPIGIKGPPAWRMGAGSSSGRG